MGALALWAPKRQRGTAIDVVVADDQSSLRSERNDLRSHFRGQGLASFVVPNVSLGTADSSAQRLLRDAEALADGLQVMHWFILAPLLHLVNSAPVSD